MPRFLGRKSFGRRVAGSFARNLSREMRKTGTNNNPGSTPSGTDVTHVVLVVLGLLVFILFCSLSTCAR